MVIGAVLIKGARAPILVSQADLKRMKPGSVIVDVAVDQGGCIETMHPTTHAVPVFTVDEVIHYGVANIPGAVPATSTFGLTNATFPYLLALANKGVKQALSDDAGLAKGLKRPPMAYSSSRKCPTSSACRCPRSPSGWPSRCALKPVLIAVAALVVLALVIRQVTQAVHRTFGGRPGLARLARATPAYQKRADAVGDRQRQPGPVLRLHRRGPSGQRRVISLSAGSRHGPVDQDAA